MFDYLANPARFQRIAAVIRPIAWLAFMATLIPGLYYAFFNSPADYQQGETVRIMYVHVPSAWMALMAYVVMALMALFYLVWKHPLADVAARSMALPGAGFALITLVTGSLWGGADVGHMVGLGCAADVNADPVVSLYWLHGFGR